MNQVGKTNQEVDAVMFQVHTMFLLSAKCNVISTKGIKDKKLLEEVNRYNSVINKGATPQIANKALEELYKKVFPM